MEKLEEAKKKAEKNLEKHFRKAVQRIEEFDPEDTDTHSDYFELVPSEGVRMAVPRDYSEEYRAAIAMFEWDVRDEVELTYAEFTCFVRDKWNWTSDFKFVAESYTKAISRER